MFNTGNGLSLFLKKEEVEEGRIKKRKITKTKNALPFGTKLFKYLILLKAVKVES